MSKLPTYKHCFICGLENEIGLKARFWIEGDGAKAECEPDARYEGYKGVVHGGVVSAMLDEVMGKAIMAVGGPINMTARLNIRFRQSAIVGQKLTFEAQCLGRKRQFFDTKGVAYNEAGQVIAEATGVFIEITGAEAEKMNEHLEWK